MRRAVLCNPARVGADLTGAAAGDRAERRGNDNRGRVFRPGRGCRVDQWCIVTGGRPFGPAAPGRAGGADAGADRCRQQCRAADRRTPPTPPVPLAVVGGEAVATLAAGTAVRSEPTAVPPAPPAPPVPVTPVPNCA